MRTSSSSDVPCSAGHLGPPAHLLLLALYVGTQPGLFPAWLLRVHMQVRNLRSCLKVAADFVPPEAMPQCLSMAQRLRRCFKEEQVRGGRMLIAEVEGWVPGHGAVAAQMLQGGAVAAQMLQGGAGEGWQDANC
eukprot:1156381-Pelagomonas_calceolata.AAC.1